MAELKTTKMTHPSLQKFTFDFVKSIHISGTKFRPLSITCYCERYKGVIDIELKYRDSEYIPWSFLLLVDKDLCEEIKTAAAQHYEGLLEDKDDELEMNLID